MEDELISWRNSSSETTGTGCSKLTLSYKCWLFRINDRCQLFKINDVIQKLVVQN